MPRAIARLAVVATLAGCGGAVEVTAVDALADRRAWVQSAVNGQNRAVLGNEERCAIALHTAWAPSASFEFVWSVQRAWDDRWNTMKQRVFLDPAWDPLPTYCAVVADYPCRVLAPIPFPTDRCDVRPASDAGSADVPRAD